MSESAALSGAMPVVFVHGLWLLPHSWDRWATVFGEAGHAPVQPGWPDNPEIIKMPNRGHSLVIDSGWREVADTALAFVQRFVKAGTPS